MPTDAKLSFRLCDKVAHLVEPGTSGYYFDGVCDGLADTMVFLSLAFYFYRHYGPSAGNYAYTRLENKVSFDRGIFCRTEI